MKPYAFFNTVYTTTKWQLTAGMATCALILPTMQKEERLEKACVFISTSIFIGIALGISFNILFALLDYFSPTSIATEKNLNVARR